MFGGGDETRRMQTHFDQPPEDNVPAERALLAGQYPIQGLRALDEIGAMVLFLVPNGEPLMTAALIPAQGGASAR